MKKIFFLLLILISQITYANKNLCNDLFESSVVTPFSESVFNRAEINWIKEHPESRLSYFAKKLNQAYLSLLDYNKSKNSAIYYFRSNSLLDTNYKTYDNSGVAFPKRFVLEFLTQDEHLLRELEESFKFSYKYIFPKPEDAEVVAILNYLAKRLRVIDARAKVDDKEEFLKVYLSKLQSLKANHQKILPIYDLIQTSFALFSQLLENVYIDILIETYFHITKDQPEFNHLKPLVLSLLKTEIKPENYSGALELLINAMGMDSQSNYLNNFLKVDDSGNTPIDYIKRSLQNFEMHFEVHFSYKNRKFEPLTDFGNFVKSFDLYQRMLWLGSGFSSNLLHIHQVREWDQKGIYFLEMLKSTYLLEIDNKIQNKNSSEEVMHTFARAGDINEITSYLRDYLGIVEPKTLKFMSEILSHQISKTLSLGKLSYTSVYQEIDSSFQQYRKIFKKQLREAMEKSRLEMHQVRLNTAQKEGLLKFAFSKGVSGKESFVTGLANRQQLKAQTTSIEAKSEPAHVELPKENTLDIESFKNQLPQADQIYFFKFLTSTEPKYQYLIFTKESLEYLKSNNISAWDWIQTLRKGPVPKQMVSGLKRIKGAKGQYWEIKNLGSNFRALVLQNKENQTWTIEFFVHHDSLDKAIRNRGL